MSRSSTIQLLTYLSIRQCVLAEAENIKMPLSAGLLYGIFIS